MIDDISNLPPFYTNYGLLLAPKDAKSMTLQDGSSNF